MSAGDSSVAVPEHPLQALQCCFNTLPHQHQPQGYSARSLRTNLAADFLLEHEVAIHCLGCDGGNFMVGEFQECVVLGCASLLIPGHAHPGQLPKLGEEA